MNTRSLLLLALVSMGGSLGIACGDDSTTGGGGQGGGLGLGGIGAGGDGFGGVNVDDCTVITQNGESVVFSTLGVGFEITPNMLTDEPDVVTVSASDKEPNIPAGKTDFTGVNGRFVALVSIDAVTDLINAEFGVDMDAQEFAAVSGSVTITDAPSGPTQFKSRIQGTLSQVVFVELNEDFEPIEGGECLYLETGTFDGAGLVADCGAQTDVANTPSGGECIGDWAEIGHSCNPVTNEGCSATEICDWGGYFRCYPVAGDEVGLCGTCENMVGPQCQAGMTCDSYGDVGKCYRYCCDDGDCGAGGTCIAYSYAPTGVGVCFTPE